MSGMNLNTAEQGLLNFFMRNLVEAIKSGDLDTIETACERLLKHLKVAKKFYMQQVQDEKEDTSEHEAHYRQAAS